MSSMPPPPPGMPPPPPPSGGPAGFGVPSYGAPMGSWAPGVSPYGPLASWGQRVGAYLLDAVIALVLLIGVFIVGAIVGAVVDALGALILVLGYLGVVAYNVYIQYLAGSTGQTPGKKIVGLKVVGEGTGQPIGGGAGIGRMFLHILDSLACYIGWLFPLWDARRQTFADKVMKSVVVSGVPTVGFVEAVTSVVPGRGAK